MRIVSIGELLYDLIGGQEYLGGATFNLAAHLRRLGHDVRFISAVGDDERGRRALARLRDLRLPRKWVQVIPGAQTGIVTVDVDPAGQPSFTIHRPAAYDKLALADEQLEALAKWKPHWTCYGTLFGIYEQTLELLLEVLDVTVSGRLYDVNLRKDCFNKELVRTLLDTADIVKLNEDEVKLVDEMFGRRSASLEEFCRRMADEYLHEAVCVTRGAQGSALLLKGRYIEAPGYEVTVKDTVGAGDSFTAALLHAIDAGWVAEEVADFANRVGALVASRSGGVPDWTLGEVFALPAPRKKLRCRPAPRIPTKEQEPL